MSLPTQITAHADPTILPLHLTGFAKLRWSAKNPPADPAVTFAGKTVLVTGANTGLGFESAVAYATKGCTRLILAVRTAEKGEEAKRQILTRSGRTEEKDFVGVLIVDLDNFESVKAFGTALERETSNTGLDIALLNAGLAPAKYIASTHGYELALQVNVLSTALMALNILPILRRTAKTSQDPPHLTFVNSAGHIDTQRAWYAGHSSLLAYLNDPKAFGLKEGYCGVKTLGMAVMQHFARETIGERVVVNACCPFYTRTSLTRYYPKPLQVAFGWWQVFTARSGEEGAR
jgi:NAD(P)-dependent dehydrogenase (short-subunit alcohol dehydrogenase family)